MSTRTLTFCLLISAVLMALGAVVLMMPGASTTGWALLILGSLLTTISFAQASLLTKAWTSARSLVPVRVSETDTRGRGY